MKKIKDFFNKKKGDVTFKRAGPGYRLSEPTTTSSSDTSSSIFGTSQTIESSQQPIARRSTGPDENVAKATLARLETKSNTSITKPTLYDIMNEEKQKISRELKMKEDEKERRQEEMKLSQQRNKNPFKEFEEAQTFTCKTLDIDSPVPFKEIIRQIKSSIYDNFADNIVLRSAMVIFNCNRSIDQNDIKLRNCLDILLKIVSNLMTDDSEQLEKFKHIRRSKIEEKVLSLDGSLDFLFAIGFTIDEKDSDWLVYVEDDADIKTKMSYLKDLLLFPQIIPIELDRQVKFVDTPQPDDDHDIQMTSADLKKYYNYLEKTNEINTMLVSKKTRANNNMSNFRPTFTKLRFKFNFADEMHLIEAVFYSNEKLSEVKTWFLEHFGEALQGKKVKFKQDLTILEDDFSTLEALKLTPASTLLAIVE